MEHGNEKEKSEERRCDDDASSISPVNLQDVKEIPDIREPLPEEVMELQYNEEDENLEENINQI